MTSYSQAGQDVWVAETLGHRKAGYFVDCGAHDGVQFSNTYMLETEYDWNGICIEAAATGFSKLEKNRRCRCVFAAVLGSHRVVPIRDDNMFGGIDEQNGTPVQGYTLAEILADAYAPLVIDYLSLDIEGCEYEVLAAIPHDRYRFLTITVEHNAYILGNDYRDTIRSLLLNNGYRLDRADVESDGCKFEDWFVAEGLA